VFCTILRGLPPTRLASPATGSGGRQRHVDRRLPVRAGAALLAGGVPQLADRRARALTIDVLDAHAARAGDGQTGLAPLGLGLVRARAALSELAGAGRLRQDVLAFLLALRTAVGGRRRALLSLRLTRRLMLLDDDVALALVPAGRSSSS
jgi:hypothetical protein